MKIQCRNCKDIIESLHVHDWRCCKCFENKVGNKGIFIDGGDEYTRIGGEPGSYKVIVEDKEK